jgi:hypothetical protein
MSAQPDPQGLGLEHGDHVCGFYYAPEERDAMLLPFLREGLQNGDKCVAVIDSTRPEELVVRIEGAEAAAASGQLELYDADIAYLSTGSFEPELTIDFWEHRAKQLADDGEFDFIRLLGELSWLDRSGAPREAIVRYESWADHFVSRYPMTILCLYDLRRMGSSVMMDLLRTHPKLLMGGLLLENPHHIRSDDFSAA